MSRKFTTTRGVKQGGPMSPFLFASFIDEILVELAKQKGICHINGIITGEIAYADDILILTESKEAL